MSDDVIIVVGARDNATKVLQNIGREGKILANQILSASKRTTEATRTTTTHIINFASNVKQFVSATIQSIGPMATKFANAMKAMQTGLKFFTFIIEAIQAVKDTFKGFGDSIEAFNTQDKAVRKLANSIDLLGGNSAESIDHHKAFAAQLQNSTNIGDEYTLGLMAQASAMGIADDKLQEVTKAAIGMSKATGMSAEEALKKMQQAITGNANALNEYIPGIINARTESQKLAMINEVATRGLALAAGEVDTLQGSMDRSAGAFGDFQEKIGELLAPIQMLVNNGFAVFYETMQSAIQPAIERSQQLFANFEPIMAKVNQAANAMATIVWAAISSIVEVSKSFSVGFLEDSTSISSTADAIGSAIQWLAESAIKAISFVEVVLRNLPSVWDLATTAIEYYLTKFTNDVKYHFSEGSVQYLHWFATNMVNLLSDAFSASLAIVTNFAKNVGNALVALWDWVASGFEGGPSALLAKVGESMGNGLLDGFESSLAPLPSLAQRQATEVEKTLSKRMLAIGTELSTDLESTYNARVANLGVATKQKLENMTVELTSAKGAADQFAQSQAGQLQAFESRMLTRGAGTTATDKIAKNTEETNKILKDQPTAMAAKIAAALPSQLQSDFWAYASLVE